MVTCDDLVSGATGIHRCCRGSLSASDANVTPESRLLLVTGGPGTGKTEAVVHCATTAAMQGARVLIGCPMGALFDTYRQRLEANENIVIETVHTSFKMARAADRHHVPPGRLRHFDLIMFDEASQLDASVWSCVKISGHKLQPRTFDVFVADFKQLHSAAVGCATGSDRGTAATHRIVGSCQCEVQRSRPLEFLGMHPRPSTRERNRCRIFPLEDASVERMWHCEDGDSF